MWDHTEILFSHSIEENEGTVPLRLPFLPEDMDFATANEQAQIRHLEEQDEGVRERISLPNVYYQAK